MSTEHAIITLLLLVLFWLAVLLHKEFSTADRKIKAIFDKEEADREQEGIRELLATMWLYTHWRYVTRNLTTEQKELWADVIDQVHQREYEEDGTPQEFVPVERWWR